MPTRQLDCTPTRQLHAYPATRLPGNSTACLPGNCTPTRQLDLVTPTRQPVVVLVQVALPCDLDVGLPGNPLQQGLFTPPNPQGGQVRKVRVPCSLPGNRIRAPSTKSNAYLPGNLRETRKAEPGHVYVNLPGNLAAPAHALTQGELRLLWPLGGSGEPPRGEWWRQFNGPELPSGKGH